MTLRSTFSTALVLCLAVAPLSPAAAALRAAPKIGVVSPAIAAAGASAAGLGAALPGLSLKPRLSTLSLGGLDRGLSSPAPALAAALTAPLTAPSAAAVPTASAAALPAAVSAAPAPGAARETSRQRLRSLAQAKDPRPLWTGARPHGAAAPSLPVFAAPTSESTSLGSLLARGEDAASEPREDGIDAGYAADTEADVLIPRRTPWLRVRDTVLYSFITLSSLYWYTFPRLAERWNELERAVAAAAGRPAAVRDFPGFFIAHRVLGSTGNYAPMGFRPAANRVVVRDAWQIFKTYFDYDHAGKLAFGRMIGRARLFNPNRGSTQFRKILFHSLREASVLRAEELPGYFDSLVTDAEAASLKEYQATEQSRVLAAFERIVRDTVLERSGGYPAGRRIIGVLLLGSFANGSAGPASDLDVQMISEDGRAAFAPKFFKIIKQKWIAAGLQADHPIGSFQYALAPSKKLLTRIHRESYRVFSPYRGVAEALERGPDEEAGPSFRRNKGFKGWLFVKLYGALLRGILTFHIIRNRLRR